MLPPVPEPKEGEDYEKSIDGELSTGLTSSLINTSDARLAIDKWIGKGSLDPDTWVPADTSKMELDYEGLEPALVPKKQSVWQGYPPERDVLYNEAVLDQRNFRKEQDIKENLEGWGDRNPFVLPVKEVADSLNAINDYKDSQAEVTSYITTDDLIPEDYWDPAFDSLELSDYTVDPLLRSE